MYLFAFVLPLLGLIPNKKTDIIVNDNSYQVIKVVDGDTIEVNIGNQPEKIRFIGIDTPETVDPRKLVQCFGLEASNKTKELLSNKRVLLESDPTQGNRDKYKRLLRYVYTLDGIMVNKFLVMEGFAHEYTYMSNPYKYQKDFKDAQKFARDNKRGLWDDNSCKS